MAIINKDFVSNDDKMYIGKDWWQKVVIQSQVDGPFQDLTNKSIFGTARANLLNTAIPDNADVEADGAFSIRWLAGTAGKLADGTTINSDGSTDTAVAGTYEQTGIYFGYIYVKAETLEQLTIPTLTNSVGLTSSLAELTYRYEIVERDTANTIFDFEGTPDITYVAQATIAILKDYLVQYGQKVYIATADFDGTGAEFLAALDDLAQFAPANTIPGTIRTIMFGTINIQARVAHRIDSSL